MKLNKILVSAVLSMICLPVAAQSNAPEKGDWTVAATVGYNSYTNVEAMDGTLINYETAAKPNFWNDKKLMVGFEAGYFVHNNWKLNLGGGLNFSHNPGYGGVPGTIDPDYSGAYEGVVGGIPNYRAVASQYSMNYNVYAGIDRYFNTGVDNLKWYVGAQVGFNYALNESKYNEEWSMGISVGQSFNLRGGFTMGMDYYVLPAMWVGVSVMPFNYTYGMVAYRPQEGMKYLEADVHTWSVLASPTIKVGFKF